MNHLYQTLLVALVCIFVTSRFAMADSNSQWVALGADGKLVYKTLPSGDRITDFSYAGYMGGGVKIPDVPVAASVNPSGGDDSETIQNAINAVAKRPLVDGFRGAVLLAPGDFKCSRTISLSASGVVLRGSGRDATTIHLTGSPHEGVSIGGSVQFRDKGKLVDITDAYVPCGANSVHVVDAATLSVGQTVVIVHPVTQSWITFMGMDTLVRDGRPETWLSATDEIDAHRVIKAISGNELSFDVPLCDNFDAHYLKPPGTAVVGCIVTGMQSQIGIESLHMVGQPQSVPISERTFGGVSFRGCADCWARDLQIDDVVSAASVRSDASRITIEKIDDVHSVPTVGAAKPADFSIDGSQVLIDRCTGKSDNIFYLVTGARVVGPNVMLNCTFHGNGHIAPHQRWATGLLLDNCKVPEAGIDLMNRGMMGSGHGWTIGWSVAWNCTAKTFVIQLPPGSADWAIGCQGEQDLSPMGLDKGGKNMPQGIIDQQGSPVIPASLYLAQLAERLGPEALKNIGY